MAIYRTIWNNIFWYATYFWMHNGTRWVKLWTPTCVLSLFQRSNHTHIYTWPLVRFPQPRVMGFQTRDHKICYSSDQRLENISSWSVLRQSRYSLLHIMSVLWDTTGQTTISSMEIETPAHKLMVPSTMSINFLTSQWRPQQVCHPLVKRQGWMAYKTIVSKRVSFNN